MSLPAPDIRATAAEELLGQTLSDRFRLDSLIGHGAMGAVFKAYHLGLKKDVALKLLHRELTANDEMVARFDREAAAVSRLDHPNCVRIMDFGSTDEGQRYLVMEYLEGEDLAQLITEPMPPVRAVELTRQVLEGLAHAHAQGLVHRDIKPENTFVTAGETGEQVKLLDFGLVKVTHGAGAGQLTQAGMIFGTPTCMSPEQARGEKADARSDLYSVGVVMYSMLAGQPPFDGDDPVAILRRQIKEKPPALPGSVPSSLRRFVMRLLAKKPEERFADATGAIGALRRAASSTEPKLPRPRELGGLPGGGRPRPKPPTLPNTATPAPKETESGFPALEELIELEAEDEGVEDAKGPPLPPPIVPGGPQRMESEDAPEPEPEPELEPEPATAPSPPPAPPGAAAAPADRPPWVLPAIGVGAICLLALIIAAWPDGNDVESRPEAVAANGASKDEDESKDEEEAEAPKESDELVIKDEVSDQVPAGDDGGAEAQSKRALRASLVSIDALIESEKYDAAQITIGPLLEVYADEPALHWRMGRVLVALGRKANATAALESYRSALSLKPGLVDDEEFAATFWDLLDDPRHREFSTRIAIELLGDNGYNRLTQWVNVQKSPLPYASRQAVTDHLRGADQGKRINEPLQTALDLWQANTAEAPCDAFNSALEAATKNPDSYLLGTLSQVSVPKTGEGDEAVECPGLAEALTIARDDYAQRYAGLDSAVPASYRRRKSSGPSNKRRRR